jgi:hypothetical protein
MPECQAFVYVSASNHHVPFPFSSLLDARYLSTKRQVEDALTLPRQDQPSLPFHRLILRPGASIEAFFILFYYRTRAGFMYADEGFTLPVSAALSLMHTFKTQVLPYSLQSILPAPPTQPLHVDVVATALLNGLQGFLKEEGASVDADARMYTSAVLEVDDMLRLVE